jgi:hypothetical protein
LSVKAVEFRGVGFVYKVQLPEETVDALGDDVEFPEEGTEIWATECMISNVRALRRVAEMVKGVRVHSCEELGCSADCDKPTYDYRVKWDGMRSQCSTWESEFYLTRSINKSLRIKGVLDNYGTQVLVEDVEKRSNYLAGNHDMSALLKLKLATHLKKQCLSTAKYFNNLYAQWGNDSADNDEPGKFPNPFEDPSELYPMRCQDAPICKDKTDEEMTAYCAICNDCGHPACMAEMKPNIILHPEQKKRCRRGSTHSTAVCLM